MNRFFTTALVLVLAAPAWCGAQEMLGPTPLEIDRAELTSLSEQYDALARSTAYSASLLEEIRAQGEAVRERLALGDFQPGSEVVVTVEVGGNARSDSLTVEADGTIEVPNLGSVSLAGILRSELEAHLETEIGRFIQTPRVRASALIRVSVGGAVGRPGFYALPSDMRLSDVAGVAGGTAGGIDPGRIQIERGQSHHRFDLVQKQRLRS